MSTHDWLLSLIDPVSAIVHDAGDIILEFDPENVEQHKKADDSPVTQADIAANEIILQGLAKLTPDIPILSEETSDRQEKSTDATEPEWFWCVDPLDGTKGFLKSSGEYSVNIALINHGEPVLGVMRVPAFLMTYRAICIANKPLLSQYQHDYSNPIDLLQSGNTRPRQKPWTVASSGAKISDTMQSLLDHHGIVKRHYAHSALKFGWIMSGKVDLMLRVHPTCSWDTAAGQAMLRSIGGDIVNYQKQPFNYHFYAPSWINRSFVAVAHKDMLSQIDFDRLPAEHEQR